MSKTILSEVDGWTPLIDTITKEYGLVTSAVFGRVWRFCQGSLGVCGASLERIADDLHLDKATVMRHAKILCASGYLVDLTPELRNVPHTYADTGKAGIKINISVAHNNRSVAQDNATVAENNSLIPTVAQDNKSVAENQLKKQSRDKVDNTQNKRQAAAVAAADPTLLKILHNAEIYEPTATEIARLPHINQEYLAASIAKARDDHVTIGILITRLRNNDPMPPTPEQVEAKQRKRYAVPGTVH